MGMRQAGRASLLEVPMASDCRTRQIYWRAHEIAIIRTKPAEEPGTFWQTNELFQLVKVDAPVKSQHFPSCDCGEVAIMFNYRFCGVSIPRIPVAHAHYSVNRTPSSRPDCGGVTSG